MAQGGHLVGDSKVYICPHCGGYRLAGTVESMLVAGSVPKPSPAAFRDLVKRKRGDWFDYPLITTNDLGK